MLPQPAPGTQDRIVPLATWAGVTLHPNFVRSGKDTSHPSGPRGFCHKEQFKGVVTVSCLELSLPLVPTVLGPRYQEEKRESKVMWGKSCTCASSSPFLQSPRKVGEHTPWQRPLGPPDTECELTLMVWGPTRHAFVSPCFRQQKFPLFVPTPIR